MTSRSESLKRSKLYVVLDSSVAGYEHLAEIAGEIAPMADVIQLRDKESSDEKYLTQARRIARTVKGSSLFIVNDRVHLAEALDADGVHIGQDDVSLRQARKILGNRRLIGVSCQSLEHAKEAQNEGADYIGFGSAFKTLTKPDRQPMDLALLERVNKEIQIPLFAIGGITLENISELIELGVRRIALTRAVLEADNVEEVVARFKEILGHKGFVRVI